MAGFFRADKMKSRVQFYRIPGNLAGMWDDFWKCINLPAELQDSAHANFVAWERLRLYYNGALVAVTLAVGAVAATVGMAMGTVRDDFWWRVIILLVFGFLGAIPVNIAFCVGTVAEGYLVRFHLSRRWARLGLLTLGLLAGAGMAAMTAMTIMSSPGANYWN